MSASKLLEYLHPLDPQQPKTHPHLTLHLINNYIIKWFLIHKKSGSVKITLL